MCSPCPLQRTAACGLARRGAYLSARLEGLGNARQAAGRDAASSQGAPARHGRGLLRAATLLAAASVAAAAAPAAAGWPLERAQCRAASCKASSNRASSSTAAPEPQFMVLRITGDGRCLFRSLAQGSHIAAQEDAAMATAKPAGAGGSGGSDTGTPLQLLASHAETAQADELRRAICQELLKRRDEIYFFIDEDFDGYVQRMQQPHTWGGEPELAVAAHVLQRPIAVYMQGTPQLVLVSRYGDEQYSEGKADVPLLFHGAGHYDLLVRQPAVKQAAAAPAAHKPPQSKL